MGDENGFLTQKMESQLETVMVLETRLSEANRRSEELEAELRTLWYRETGQAKSNDGDSERKRNVTDIDGRVD